MTMNNTIAGIFCLLAVLCFSVFLWFQTHTLQKRITSLSKRLNDIEKLYGNVVFGTKEYFLERGLQTTEGHGHELPPGISQPDTNVDMDTLRYSNNPSNNATTIGEFRKTHPHGITQKEADRLTRYGCLGAQEFVNPVEEAQSKHD